MILETQAEGGVAMAGTSGETRDPGGGWGAWPWLAHQVRLETQAEGGVHGHGWQTRDPGRGWGGHSSSRAFGPGLILEVRVKMSKLHLGTSIHGYITGHPGVSMK